MFCVSGVPKAAKNNQNCANLNNPVAIFLLPMNCTSFRLNITTRLQ